MCDTTKCTMVVLSVALACASTADVALSQSASRGSEPATLSADQLLSIAPMVKGADNPVWHPDGERIAFLGSAGGPLGIWSVSANGGPPQLLVDDVSLSGLDYTAGQHPLWSPTGDYLAYVSTKGGDAPEIWLWSAHEGRSTQLTRLGGGIYSMNWSPDGSRIALLRRSVRKSGHLHRCRAERRRAPVDQRSELRGVSDVVARQQVRVVRPTGRPVGETRRAGRAR